MTSSKAAIYRLLNYDKKGIFRTVFGRAGFIFLMFAFEIVFSVLCIINIIRINTIISIAAVIFTACIVIAIISSDLDSCAKLSWVLLTLFLPVAGGLFYLYSIKKTDNAQTADYTKNISRNKICPASHCISVLAELKDESPDVFSLAMRLNQTGSYPIYRNCKTDYYSYGEYKFATLLSDLEKAEKCIFLEYFIVEEGKMWGSILDILVKKARQGLDVRLIYDGNCELNLLPISYPDKLCKLGIKCKVFSRYHPVFSVKYNFRDHRKLVVIDGKIAYTGGINLADNYINHDSAPQSWKDTAVRVEGECVNSFTVMFLEMWHDGRLESHDEHMTVKHCRNRTNGYIIPFGYSPFDRCNSSVLLYSDILQKAKRYVYIMTPFLAIGDGMLHLLKNTAERGIDVKLIMSGIPDNKPMQMLSETYYKTLIKSGVSIYRYNKGVVHAKMFLSDDEKAVVGSINLDYRSLYHNFECGVFLYKTDCISDIKQDFAKTLTACEKVSIDTIHSGSIISKAVGSVMRIAAPLM